MRPFPEPARPALAPYVALAVLFLAESIYLGRFAFFVLEMWPGDVLVAFTDGISEAMNADGELWGEERLLATFATCDGLGASEILAHITGAADQFAAGAKQNDDMTLIVARVMR